MAILSDNPLVARLIRHEGRFQGRLGLWLPFALGMASGMIALYSIFGVAPRDPFHTPNDLFPLLFLGNWLLTTILPLVIAVIAAMFTANDSRTDAYKVLSLTNFANRQLASAYVIAILYRLRAPLAFMVGLLPMQTLVGMFPSGYSCMNDCYPYWIAGGPVQSGLDSTIVGIGFWFLYVLAAEIGVWLGLWWRNARAAAGGALVLTLGVLYASMRANDLLYGFSYPFAPTRLAPNLAELLRIVAGSGVVDILPPLVMIVFAQWIAARWARKPD